MSNRKKVNSEELFGWLLSVSLLSMIPITLFVKARFWMSFSVIILSLLGCAFLTMRFRGQIKAKIKSKYQKIHSAFWEKCQAVLKNWYIRAGGKISNKNNIDLLGPKTLEYSRYVEILKSTVDDPNVRNIAISGPYGSGKSTVIYSFENIFPKYKCLNLSLATFAEECQEQQNQEEYVDPSGNPTDKITQKNKKELQHGANIQAEGNDISMAKLEYSLVQQFFYHVKACKIPESRFGRIHRWNKCHKLLWSLFIFFYLLLFILCFGQSLCKNMPILSSIPINESLDKIYFVAFISFSFYILYCIVGLIHRIKSANVKVMDYEVSFNKDEKISVFNHYLDELVYLFQSTGYEIVVLEDLDRFRNTSIFTKLRELNQLLNQSKDIDRRIVFIYALRDDIFQDAKERTKFFDYIIPIIPYVNVSNSAAHFVEYFQKFIGNEPNNLHKSFISDIAPYVSDLRTIKAILADFKNSQNFLNDGLHKDKLLAMLLYKNLYPNEFGLLYEGKGPLKEIFDNKRRYISEQKQKDDSAISELRREIDELKRENLSSIQELNILIVGALAQCITANTILLNNSQEAIPFPSVNNSSEIEKIINGEFYYRHINNSWNIYPITREMVYSKLPSGFSYDKRRNLIDTKLENGINKLQTRIDTIKKEQNEIESLTMEQLCSKYPEILGTAGHNNGFQLLHFLVRRGYIDEQYHYYYTVFKEGILSSNDHEYVMAVKNIGITDEDQIGRALDNPQAVLSYLVDRADYQSNMILNSMLVHEIIESKTDDKLDWILEKIKQGETICLDFINRYPYPEDGLFYYLSDRYPNLWIDFISDTLFSNESKLILFERIIKYATVQDINSMNVDDELSVYLEGYGYPQEITKDKAKEIIETLKPQFKKLIDDSNGNNLLDYSFQNDYYQLNQGNISLIINKYSNLDLGQYKSAIYSAIVESGIGLLSNRVENEIENFVKYIVLSVGNTGEHETPFINLLNNESISIEIRQRLISHNRTGINAIEQVNELDLTNLLFEQRKVTPSWGNIKHYFEKNGIEETDDRISIFINQNKEVIAGEIMDITSPDREDINLIKMILDCPTINDYLWKAILNFPQYDICWADSPESLRKKQVQFLIEKKRIKFNAKTMKQILSVYVGISNVLFEQYHSELINAVDEFEFSADELISFAEKDIFKDDTNVLYGLIQKDDIVNEHIANKYLEFSVSKGSVYPFDVFKQALCVSKDLTLKIKAITEYFNRGLTPRDIDGFFEELGEPFVKLNKTGQYVIFYNSEISPLLTSLQKRGFVGKETTTKASIKVWVKKRNKS